MTSVACRQCGRVLEFSGQRPRFCAYCGQPLDDSGPGATVDHVSPTAGSDLTLAEPSAAVREDYPERLAGYRLVRRIGGGGMGTVFEAEDEAHGRRVALKVLTNRLGAGPESIERFRQEGRLAGTISHPRCVFVLAADEVDDRPYIVMELMTGQTLQGLVDRRGPLPVEEAVARILDVIVGLMEAHRVGVIHRDVKPSNCFLEADGRVKVGDFGLSKSLVDDARLTRTGSFIGTPLYASPEQIKGDPVDVRTDVYSASATLYFLLTGGPPFDASDAAAALARIVSEAPRPLRERRPDAPAGLESAILRGMERDRDRRWRSLAELRDALLPFAPHPIPAASPMMRVGAAVVDQAILLIGVAVVELLAFRPLLGDIWGLSAADLVVWLAYFIPLEGIWSGSVGKHLLRLRVIRADRRAEPGLLRSAVRAGSFFGITFLPAILATSVMEQVWGDRLIEGGRESLAYGVSLVVLPVLGLAIVSGTMRRRDGYRGLHELASRTRTVQLPRAGRRREAPARRRSARDSTVVRRPMGVLEQVGPYRVRGAVRWEADRRVLAAEDAGLGREVWVVLGPRGSEPPEAARRDLIRPTRSRWISGGQIPEGRWDAYTAPSGAPLADVAGPDGLPWSEARPILAELAEELAAALGDGTLPGALGVDQVWVEPDGRSQLVDPLGGPPRPVVVPGADDERRALDLLARVAALALEGGRRRASDSSSPIRSPVPQHARVLLDRLTGHAPRFDRVAEARDALRATAGEPDELGVVPRANRLGTYLASIPLRIAVVALLVWLLGASGLDRAIPSLSGLSPALVVAALFAGISLVLWPAMAAVSRCRWLSGLIGAVLVRNDGASPSRLRCALREAIAWSPPLALTLLAVAVEGRSGWGAPGWFIGSFDSLPVLWMLADMAHELAFPGMMLHDRLARTRLVPR